MAVLEKKFITRTPETIKVIPTIAAKSSFSLKMKTEIKAVNTIPKPPQIAYAKPRLIVFSDKEKK